MAWLMNLRQYRMQLAVVLAAIVLLGMTIAQFAPRSASADASSAFQRTWARHDAPVSSGQVSRTWMWGPSARTAILQEDYLEAPGGERQVQYFDKSRMELTNPDADAESIWYITNGLLVVELVSGKLQLGDAEFQTRQPADIPVAGDPDDATGPTYAALERLLYAPPYAEGQVITLRVDRDGEITEDPALASWGVTAAWRVQLPGLDHMVASPFWEFMNSRGPVEVNGQIIEDRLFENPFYATGYPITEAFFATVKVDGTPRTVLIQAFERRVLTWTPDNEPGWQVEAGNVGMHYYDWRYADDATPTPTPTTTPNETPVTVTTTSTSTTSPTATATATATAPASGTTLPTATMFVPTNTPVPTATPSPTPTNTPTVTPTPTNTPTATATSVSRNTSEQGQARVVPWSGYWWPFVQSSNPNLYDPNGAMDKYDQYVQATRGTNPGARAWEETHHYGGSSWWGHCNAWAAASISEPEPRAVTRAGISFTQDQVEGLLTELYMSPAYQMWGTQCNGCGTESATFKDVTPADFDRILREMMGQQGRNVIMDTDPGTEVWNYPAYRYERTSVVNGTTEQVTMRVLLALPAINATGTVSDWVTYTYTLTEGTSGEWTGSSVRDHPDFIWVVNGRTSSISQVNPHVKYEIVQEIIRGN